MATQKPQPPVAKNFRADEIEPALRKLRRRLERVKALLGGNVQQADPSLAVARDEVIATIVEVFGPDSPQYRSNAELSVWAGPMWADMSDDEANNGSRRGLVAIRTLLESLIATVEEAGIDHTPNLRAAAAPLADLHPLVRDAAQMLFADGHYRQAVFDASVALVGAVRTRAGSTEDGVRLMRSVFQGQNPLLRVNALADQSDRDEQDGIANLMVGAVSGIRNPRAHGIRPDSAQYALEALYLLSFLARYTEGAQKP